MEFGLKMQFIQLRSGIAAFPISFPAAWRSASLKRFKLYFALHYGESIRNIHHFSFALPVYSPAGIRCNRSLTRFEEICILKEFFFMWSRREEASCAFFHEPLGWKSFFMRFHCAQLFCILPFEGCCWNVNFSACSEILSQPEEAQSLKHEIAFKCLQPASKCLQMHFIISCIVYAEQKTLCRLNCHNSAAAAPHSTVTKYFFLSKHAAFSAQTGCNLIAKRFLRVSSHSTTSHREPKKKNFQRNVFII